MIKKTMAISKLFYQGFVKKDDKSRFKIAERVFNKIYPKYLIGDWGKECWEDQEFLHWYNRYIGVKQSPHNYERKYNLRELLKLTRYVDGDTAELGTYLGLGSYLVLDFIQGSDKQHFMFDSWEGLSAPKAIDGDYWRQGNLSASLESCKANLDKFDERQKRFLKGWIPERFAEVKDRLFSFVHIDVDLYQPTLDSLDFFYQRVVKGGVIVFDDYDYKTCPGVNEAVNEFFADKDQDLIRLTTQAFIVRR